VPEAEIARRGGATRVRTIKLSDDRYMHVFVVPKKGPRGGHTVAGEIRHSHGRHGNGSSRMEPDSQPAYKIKPNTAKKARGTIKKKVAKR